MSLSKGNCFLISAILAVLFQCCTGESEIVQKAYFDFDSLVNSQVMYLAEKKPTLHKEAFVDGLKEDVYVKPADSAAWARELAIFRQLDLINKPINKDNYVVKDGLPDPNSNLLVSEYRAAEDKKVALSYLKIYYQDTPANIRKIEGLYNEENALYTSSRFLTMELSNIYNHTVLTSYTITGGQKMILGDSVEFKIDGTLSYPL